MGTVAHVVVVGNSSLVARAFARLDDLERRWSRFRPESEISRMNRHAGEHVVVSPETFLLVERAKQGWVHTGGLFDPTVLPALRAAGYDRDFRAVRSHAPAIRTVDPGPSPGCEHVECDALLRAITVPPGVEVDPGGIGKGLAADLVTEELLDAGAHGALVNVGGDLRVRGEAPRGGAWDVAVHDPARPAREVARIALSDGAVATSSRAQRCWSTRTGLMHHLIDPRTGRPGATRFATATAVAADGWWAEVVTKAVLIGGLTPAERTGMGAHVATIDRDGYVECDPALRGVAA
jgi:thiamine biosynthesis lipoprotein